jgi:hypothetical protein
MGLRDEAKAGLRKFARLDQLEVRAAGNWRIVADGPIQRLPLRTPVALLAACVLASMHPQSFGKITESLPHNS